MTFLSPEWLWLLAGVAALVGVYVVVQGTRRRYEVRFTNLELLDRVAPRRPGWRRHAVAATFLLAAIALVLSVARPARDERVPRERATVMMAIDTSLSMQATDVAPTRLDAAEQAARSFLDLVPDRIRVGLVTFNGVAQVRVSPTTERAELLRAIEAAATDEDSKGVRMVIPMDPKRPIVINAESGGREAVGVLMPCNLAYQRSSAKYTEYPSQR